MNISFIGFGHMAKAIAQGLLSDKDHELRAAAPSLPIGINEQGISTHSDNLAVIPNAKAIILAVKPSQMSLVFQQIKPQLSPECLVISIAAGLSLSWFESQECKKLPIVRAMPNIAAAVGKSATPLIANNVVTSSQKQIAEQIFATIGLTHWVKQESDMDLLTAFTGSGPAYIFLLMEAMTKAAIALGLSTEIAESFALQLLEGTASLAQASNDNFAILRQKVSSPAGTTAAAIEVLTQANLSNLVLRAMNAAKERAQELGQLYTSDK